MLYPCKNIFKEPNEKSKSFYAGNNTFAGPGKNFSFRKSISLYVGGKSKEFEAQILLPNNEIVKMRHYSY